MIACVGPTALSYEDTYNTLKYAARARTIKTKVSNWEILLLLMNYSFLNVLHFIDCEDSTFYGLAHWPL